MKTYIERELPDENRADILNGGSPFSWQKLLKEQENSLVIDEDEGEYIIPTPNPKKMKVHHRFSIKPIGIKQFSAEEADSDYKLPH